MRDDGGVNGSVETEVKIRVGDLKSLTSRLGEIGFTVHKERLFEANTLYDKPDKELQRAGMLLRLRQAGDKNVITWKGEQQAGPHKSRPECETTIGSLDVLGEIFEHLGYRRSFRYEKFRTEFKDPGDPSGVVTLDETPIGNFMELEGPGKWIDCTAQQLGFPESEYVLESYGRLYLTDCERRGVQPTNMVFAS